MLQLVSRSRLAVRDRSEYKVLTETVRLLLYGTNCSKLPTCRIQAEPLYALPFDTCEYLCYATIIDEYKLTCRNKE